MHRIAAGLVRGADEAAGIQPGGHGRVAEELHGLVGFLQGGPMAILRVPGHDGLDAEATCGPHDAQRDLGAIGDEESSDGGHGRVRRRAGLETGLGMDWVIRFAARRAPGVDAASCSSRATRPSSDR